DRTDVYTISELAPKPVLVVDAAGLKSAPIVDPAGNAVIYVVPAVNPLRRPPESRAGQSGRAGGPGESGSPGDSGGPGRSFGGGRGGTEQAADVRQQPTFGIIDLRARSVRTIVGSAPALSGDGRTLAYVARNGGDFALMLGPTLGEQSTMKTTARRLDAPALSADGSRAAYRQWGEDDWEIFVADRSGTKEVRVPGEIQHALLPRFLAPDRLRAVRGELRHRRSYLYDVAAGPGATPRRTRLFHNNT